MVEKSGASHSRFLVGVMLGASLALIALAVWMIAKGQGAPVFVAVAGTMLASSAAVIAAQSNRKR